ncbi:phosphatidylinositol-specific phospholipase C domain-containing protein [Myxococcus stipitatus]|uniref:phosphatidylinositol-specific phospholipase C domain-containing protein n=1 Tax=Myxococcus stipitatus TaxID=83455 RepID=UPI001F2D45DE|nr:phosphatidylinositol-specific phospholipase C [Myxococcus stipitatus]MCE9672524.1 phosphatidylinositol-specific phospholipase C domain-containing protein [Myxococcus stipitatus]
MLFALAVVALAAPASARGRYYNHSGGIETSHPTWMSWVPGGTSLAALSLPGTHDTMAYQSYGGDLTQTQSLDLRSQLDAGIRALDIRCRHIDNAFTIHHGVVYLHVNFDDVLRTTIQFLNANPTETVVMRVKKEHTEENVTRTFAQTFEAYRDQPAYSPYLWRGSHVPTLGEVRGKIVILDDFAGGAYGIPWGAISLQDDWTVSQLADIDDKWFKVRDHLARTNTGAPGTLFVNFLSGSSALAYPLHVAGGINILGVQTRGVNDYAIDHLVGGNVQRAGVMMMDFPGAGLIDAILALNFRLLPASSELPTELSTIFRNTAYTIGGDAEARWHGIQTFIHNTAPGRYWHVMALKSGWGAWMHYDGTFLQSDSMEDYTHLAFSTRTVTSTVGPAYLASFVNAQLASLTGGAGDRAPQLHARLSGRFPFQRWSVVVKKSPGGLSNWAYSDYGRGYKTTSGDYIYAVQGYSASDGVYLHEHDDYEGNVLHLTSNVMDLTGNGFNDMLSSVTVLGRYQATLCEHANLTGRCLTTSQSVSALGALSSGPWNDQVSSISVTPR